jgi:hypothetical protein
VLVVWEPVLVTDWRAPGHTALARIPDKRAKQFWDPKHLVSQQLNEIAKELPGQPKPDCCVNDGFFWDDAILYAPHAQSKAHPASVFWNGPVVDVMPDIEKALSALPSGREPNAHR